ncbi:hypothetical protein CRYUN_Cryun02cG0165400 [Craigia yunnanensis]
MAGEGVSRETQMSVEASSMFPGFRFSPTDVELISYYLKKKLDGYEKCVEVISEIEICRHEPWDLPAKSIIKSENEWFFFCARGRSTQMVHKVGGQLNRVIGKPQGKNVMSSQDSLVVCRLRKNSEFHLNNTSNRAPRNQQHLSAMQDSNHFTSDGGTDKTGMSEGDKAVEFHSKKPTCSYDSHSIEQIDSASESEQNLSNDVGPTEFLHCRRFDSCDEEDYFAEILKDDIIKLDETSLSATPDILPMIASTSDAERRSQQPRQENIPHVSHFQGTANRRIKLRRPKADILCAKASEPVVGEISIEKLSSPKSEESTKYLLSLFSLSTANLRLMLEGKVAVITGGASGLGKCITRTFVKHGTKVLIAGIKDELGKFVSKDIGPEFASFVSLRCDQGKRRRKCCKCSHFPVRKA